ncbi:MAG: trimethylamine methyltransferase family protein [Dehalobacterium sp.]
MTFQPFKMITAEDYQRIHEASLKILRETGVVFHSQEAIGLFQEHGARVNGEIVYLDAPMVEKALESCPKKFTWHARDEEKSVTVGEDILIQPNIGPVYIQDLDQGRRMATLKDLSNIVKLCQASDVIDLNGSVPVDPSDVEGAQKYYQIMYEILKHTDKPIIGACVTGPEARKMLEMAEIAMGEGSLEHPSVGVLVNSLTPLGFAPDTIESIIEYSKRKQIILLAPCIMAGVSGPVSLLGTAVLQNVELLAGIVLTQLVNPGTPVVYAAASSVGYMKNASYAAGSPEAMMINTPNIQMGLDYYHLPTRTMCGISHSKALDAQAGYETMMSLMMGLMSGAHIFVQCLGVLDAIMTTSYEKLIIDEELVRRVKHIRKGIDTSDQALAVDIIQEVGHGGTYLTHESTFEGFRDIWTPTISNWDSYADWLAQGGEDVARIANRRYKEILAQAPESLLDSEVDKALQFYLK